MIIMKVIYIQFIEQYVILMQFIIPSFVNKRYFLAICLYNDL